MSALHLRNIRLKIQPELPHQLRLPSESNRELRHNFGERGLITFVKEDKTFALIPVLLLDRESTFEVFQVMNLPIPSPNPKQKLGVVAKYKLKAESITFNLARTKSILLTKKEAEKCKTDALETCMFQSPIYATRGHRLCLIE